MDTKKGKEMLSVVGLLTGMGVSILSLVEFFKSSKDRK